MKALKKIFHYVINTCSILIVILSVVLLISVIFAENGNIPNVMGYSLLRVLTGSMDPEIPTDSLIIVKHTPASELQEGDVISFYSADPQLDGMVNTHRITRIEAEGDGCKIYTKGDANSIEDEYPTDEDHVIGRVIWSNNIVGKVVRLVANPLIFVPIIIAPLLLILLFHIRQVVHTTKEIANEQEEAYQEALANIVKNKQKKKEQQSVETSEESETNTEIESSKIENGEIQDDPTDTDIEETGRNI